MNEIAICSINMIITLLEFNYIMLMEFHYAALPEFHDIRLTKLLYIMLIYYFIFYYRNSVNLWQYVILFIVCESEHKFCNILNEQNNLLMVTRFCHLCRMAASGQQEMFSSAVLHGLDGTSAGCLGTLFLLPYMWEAIHINVPVVGGIVDSLWRLILWWF